MEKNLISKIKLMMSYEMGKTLTENKITNNIIDENDAEIVEQGVVVKDLVAAGKVGKDLKAGLQDLAVGAIKDNNAILVKDAKGKLVAAQTGDDILNAIKKGTINAQELAKVNFGLFKSVGTSQNTLKLLATDIIESPKFMKEYMGKWKPNKPEELKKILKGRGYSESGAEAIISKIETNKLWKNIETNKAAMRGTSTTTNTSAAGADAKAAEGGVTVNVNQTVNGASGNVAKATEEAVAAGDGKVKEILDNTQNEIIKKPSRWARWKAWGERNPKSKKLLYLLGFGGAAYAAYKMLFSDTTPEQAKQLTFSNCAGSLIDDAGTIIQTTKGGDPVLKVTKTGNQEYDSKGGLLFYNNGRVFMGDQSNRGYWSCKGGQTVVAESQLLNEAEIDPETFNEYVDDISTYLARYVTEYNLKDIKAILLKIKGNTFEGKNALAEFLNYYQLKNDSTFVDDINSVGVKTFVVTGTKLKREILQIVGSTSGGSTGGDGNSATGVDSIINIKWDGTKSGGGDNSGGGDGAKKTTKYYDCTSVNLDTTALTYGCKDKRIQEIQGCLGIAADGKFGPVTRKALTDNAYDISKGITKAIYEKVLAGCNKGGATAGTTDGSLADVNYLRNPIKLDLTPTPELPKFSRNTETGEEFYNRLVANGNFRAGTIGDNRVKYKGADLNVDDLKKLNDFISSNGYSLIKTKDKGAQYGGGENDKYVWQKSE